MKSMNLRHLVLFVTILLFTLSMYRFQIKQKTINHRIIKKAIVDSDIFRVIVYTIYINNSTITKTYSHKIDSVRFNLAADNDFFHKMNKVDLYSDLFHWTQYHDKLYDSTQIESQYVDKL